MAWASTISSPSAVDLHARVQRLLLRGVNKVRGEWAMICTARNLAKLTA